MPQQFSAKVLFALFALGFSALVPAEEPARLPPLKPSWQTSTVPVRKGLAMNNVRGADLIMGTLKRDLEALAQKRQAALPGFLPLATNGKVLFRNYDGVMVCNLKGEAERVEWWALTDGGVCLLASDPNRVPPLESWSKIYRKSGPPGVLFRNSLIGTLSTDGQRVFVVDDLALPPPPEVARRFKELGKLSDPPINEQLWEQVQHNSLHWCNLQSGKISWILGGESDRTNLKQTFFLGPPLPVDGKLYFLNEKDRDIRLVCLQAKDDINHSRPPEVLWTQSIAAAAEKLAYDPGRRLHAAVVAETNGVLLCLTNAGTIAAVERASHKVLWKYQYQAPAGVLPLFSGWSDAAIRVHDGDVVFTAPDGPAVYCVKLKDGSLVWKADRDNDLYLAAIHDGRVILVGSRACRALRLEDGKPAWRRAIGPPSGRGVVAGPLLFLPQASPPEIDILDMATGAWVTWLPVAGGGAGNLAWAGGTLIS